MDSILRDLKFSARSLLKRPTLTLIAIITLSVGIGANSAIFGVVNALLLNPINAPALNRVPAVWESQPAREQPVFDVRTMEEVRAVSVSIHSFSSVSLGIFAGIALLLAAIGIYGVTSSAVTQRTQEIGILMALGARTREVLRMVVRTGCHSL